MIKLITLRTAEQLGLLFVDVTAEDIERGECADASRCAISHTPGHTTIFEDGKTTVAWLLPPAASELVRRFDETGRVEPLEFTATIWPPRSCKP